LALSVPHIMRGLFFWGVHGGPSGEETLDQPLSNYDVIGIPTERWSSPLYGCFSNIIPSCVVSFFCPCIMWGQIVVRAQIPLLIGLKNSLEFMRRNSGYGLFVEYFFWSIVISLALIITIVAISGLDSLLVTFIVIMLVFILGPLLYLLGHTRTAFREKYAIRGECGPGCAFWEMVLDAAVMLACLPCALAQMARHVFQYDRMDTKLGLFLSDPSALPPLPPLGEGGSGGDGTFQRPRIADEAGLAWANDNPLPGTTGRENTGAAHRQQEMEQRQRDQLIREATATTSATQPAATPTTATAVNASSFSSSTAAVMAEARVVK